MNIKTHLGNNQPKYIQFVMKKEKSPLLIYLSVFTVETHECFSKSQKSTSYFE